MKAENGKRHSEEEINHTDLPLCKKGRVDDTSYFKSYENFELHAMMISDTSRTMTYKRAILSNYLKLYKSSVADIGCGTGILSLFCAMAGAKSVYALECSSFANVAKKIVDTNDFKEKIHVINAKAEEVELPEKVDAIVSEWMGYGLLYENMLSSVIDFRDRFLKEDGLMFPATAKIFVVALGDEGGNNLIDETREFWNEMSDTYKVNFSAAMTELNVAEIRSRAHVDLIVPQAIISRECNVLEIDLKTVTKEELKCIKSPFRIVCFGDSRLCGLVMYFDVAFPGGLVLSTSPAAEPTHWQQVIVYFDDSVDVTQDTVIEGEFALKQSDEYHRFMDICVVAKVQSKDGKLISTIDQRVKLN